MTIESVPGALTHHAISTYTGSANPSAFLALNEGNSNFTAPGVEGVIVYRRSGRCLVQFGGPFAPAEDYSRLLAAFTGYARRKRLRLVSVQLQHADAVRYAAEGFTVNQIGASYAVDLAGFSLRGSRFVRLRNKISRARRSGLVVREAAAGEWDGALRELDACWLAGKGKHARPLEFLVGQHGGAGHRHRRLFVGTVDGRPAGYISYSPVYGNRSGWLHDLSRRRPDGPPGVAEAINSHAIEVFRGEGVRWLHFGFTPFTGLGREYEVPGHSPAFRWLVGKLWERGEAVYPARSQLAYKEKWAPDTVFPEYIAFRGRASLRSLTHVFRAANAL
ncbi:bifunctional lysylphosphatidylglycerol flippase/synthetase MprF [Streptomyces sp. NPDC053560]|uniref:bifunctional lysylphosphatidylglycerol flippase/synthetase MprF n=1 Tax=Streptomyces sp. NPDC053560 TaxID=3365711 RepID=UPI0037D6E90B